MLYPNICFSSCGQFVNMGVKTLSRSPSPVVPECDFRLAQEVRSHIT